jgi:hypothetical protein
VEAEHAPNIVGLLGGGWVLRENLGRCSHLRIANLGGTVGHQGVDPAAVNAVRKLFLLSPEYIAGDVGVVLGDEYSYII